MSELNEFQNRLDDISDFLEAKVGKTHAKTIDDLITRLESAIEDAEDAAADAADNSDDA